LLGTIGLDRVFAERGVKIRDCFIHGESGALGQVTFRDLPGKYPYVLSLPQTESIGLLHQKLSSYPGVKMITGSEVMDVTQDDVGCRVAVTKGPDHTREIISAKFVAACDGSRSRIRAIAGLRAPGREYRPHFVMGDFIDDTSLRQEAHLFFTAAGSVESFPLPAGRRRWIVQTRRRQTSFPTDCVGSIVFQRTGMVLPPSSQLNQSAFTPRRFNCTRYYKGRVILCGDAAHGMSPVGGQGMNTGFADAEFLAGLFSAVLGRGAAAEPLLAGYDRFRRRAAQSAISRAGWGMWLGTWKGRTLSRVRDFFIRNILCRGFISRRMGPFYAMLTIPYHSLDRVPLPGLQVAGP
jgi:2-polyprenyl-6-methoxyphenol hydroxylase-like FAD-dependent oxidoreductase